MSSRERILATLNHEEPDRIPFELFEFAGQPNPEFKQSDKIYLFDRYVKKRYDFRRIF